GGSYRDAERLSPAPARATVLTGFSCPWPSFSIPIIRRTTMTILVTGGAGYIGSHMVHALADAGERVVVLDNLSTGFRRALPPEVPLVVGETGDEALVGATLRDHRVEAIIHFAASIVVPDSVRDPLGYYRNN